MREPRRVTALASVLLAPNPGPMTLDGTNSYLLRGPGSRGCVVVDPGPADAGHLTALAAAGPVELILITHGHHDHTDGAERLRELTGATVRAASPEHCHGGDVLVDGEELTAAGVAIRVLATPGHSADSVSFALADDGPAGAGAAGSGPAPALAASTGPSAGAGSVLTGDTVLGRGSTVVGIPDGTLAQYLDSLSVLAGCGAAVGLPAHGPVIADLPAVAERYRRHRLDRLDQVRQALTDLGLTAAGARTDDGIAALLAAVYPNVEPAVAFAAAVTVDTQLAYLAAE